MDVETYFPGGSCTTSLPRIPGQNTPSGAACFINGALYTGYMSGGCLQLVSYNFTADSWTSLSCSLSQVTSLDPYTCLGNRIYLYNDYSPNYYDTMDRAWHLTSKPEAAAGLAPGMCDANGMLYVFGSGDSFPIQKYNPVTDIWSILKTNMTYSADMRCQAIPGTENIVVLSIGSPNLDPNNLIGIFSSVTDDWLSPLTKQSINFIYGSLLIYGRQFFMFSGVGANYAYCPNSSTTWQSVPNVQPLTNPRYGTFVTMVPNSLLNLPATCVPANYQCT